MQNKKRLSSKMRWESKGIRYHIRREYEIIEELKSQYSIGKLCNEIAVSKSGYYKWRYRKENPSLKEISGQSNIKLIKEVHKKYPSHGYRWINSFIRNKYGIVMSDNHVHLYYKYKNIRLNGKHYQ